MNRRTAWLSGRPDILPAAVVRVPVKLLAGLPVCITMFGMLAVSLLLPTAANGGAWTFEQGHGVVIATGNWTGNNTLFGGSLSPSASRFVKREARVYAEYGVTDWLTAIVQPELVNIHLNAPNRATYSGLGYSRLGLRARVFESGRFVVSAEGQIALPGPSDQPNRAQVGNTGPETDARLNAGYGFELFSRQSFVDASIGYRTRGGRPPDEYRADFAFGIRPVSDWLILLQSFNSISNGAGAPGFPQQSSSKLQLSVVYDFAPSWSVQAGVLQTVASRRTGTETGALAALWYRF